MRFILIEHLFLDIWLTSDRKEEKNTGQDPYNLFVKIRSKENMCCIIDFLKWKCVPARVPFRPFCFFPRKRSTFLEIYFIDSWFFQLLCFILLDQVIFRKITNNHTVMLLTLHFSTPKMSGCWTSWGGWVTRTNKLIDCSLKIKSTTHPNFSGMFWVWN